MQNEIFIGWGTLAMLVAGLAQGKNRSAVCWFIATLIFGPLALLCLLFCEKLKK